VVSLLRSATRHAHPGYAAPAPSISVRVARSWLAHTGRGRDRASSTIEGSCSEVGWSAIPEDVGFAIPRQELSVPR